ncbi:MAG TPA: COX15/CtaA family protein [Chloroflexota bacterium]|nr:COX15/CtaA family protein [Chloroflexota bacterium]
MPGKRAGESAEGMVLERMERSVPGTATRITSRARRAGLAITALERPVRWLAVATTLVMVVVLLQGTLVTNTGSQAGCGDTWPLCRGKLIPELSGVQGAATMIEFSHRVVVPLVTTMILLLSAGMVLLWRRRSEVKVLVPAMIAFLFLQAILGAMAVMWPTSATVLALHFGISLLAFASVFLSTAFVLEAGGADAVRDRPVPTGLRALIWVTFAWTYIQIYLGAYVRHTSASLACADWPLCQGALVPHLDQYVGVQFGHRLGAVVLTLLIAGLWWQARRIRAGRPDLHGAALAAIVLVVLQAISGGIVVLSRLAILSTLLHSFLITLLFGAVSYLCYHSMRRPAQARAAVPASAAMTGILREAPSQAR